MYSPLEDIQKAREQEAYAFNHPRPYTYCFPLWILDKYHLTREEVEAKFRDIAIIWIDTKKILNDA